MNPSTAINAAQGTGNMPSYYQPYADLCLYNPAYCKPPVFQQWLSTIDWGLAFMFLAAIVFIFAVMYFNRGKIPFIKRVPWFGSKMIEADEQDAGARWIYAGNGGFFYDSYAEKTEMLPNGDYMLTLESGESFSVDMSEQADEVKIVRNANLAIGKNFPILCRISGDGRETEWAEMHRQGFRDSSLFVERQLFEAQKQSLMEANEFSDAIEKESSMALKGSGKTGSGRTKGGSNYD